tara:strand:- start:1391 stop:2326 length:936 start_codon:yes stop_codon:yes gene_type:complete
MKKIEKAVIFGGSGFIGSDLSMKLSKIASEIIVLSRNPGSNKDLKVIPNLKMKLFNLNDDKNIRESLKNCDIVINAIGILNEDGNKSSFNSIHYELVERISSAVKANNIKRLLHISSLNADLYAPSQYLRSKGKAEDYLLNITSKFSRVTIFRPSIVFGENDSFFNRFDKLLKYLFIFPLACPKSKFQPIYVSDLTDFMISTINNSKYYNVNIDTVGPKVYSFIELIKLTLKITKRKRIIIPLNNLLSKIQAHIFQRLPGKIFTIDNYNSLQLESVSNDGYKGHSTVEEIVPKYLTSKNKIDSYRKKSGRK